MPVIRVPDRAVPVRSVMGELAKAPTPATLPEAGRITDGVRLGALTKTNPLKRVRAPLGANLLPCRRLGRGAGICYHARLGTCTVRYPRVAIDSAAADMPVSAPLSVAIPTYRREQVLIDTIECLLRLDPRAAEILVLDQTVDHTERTRALLGQWDKEGQIRWLCLPEPSIPRAMNQGLLEARQDIVLFIDDDIVPFPDLVGSHAKAQEGDAGLVAGRILQPWDGDIRDAPWAAKQFASTEEREIDGFMGGNFSLRRKDAIQVGGFDENFVRVAYNFEREFADRWRAAGGKIEFCPQAAIRHLKASTGGTRSFGEHLTTPLPAHAVGAYYYLLRSQLAKGRIREFLARPFRAVMTRHHLRRPWWIPVTLVAELIGMIWALVLHARGPRYCAMRSAGSG